MEKEWREFEKLLLKLISKELRLDEKNDVTILLTDAQKDGGYDGIFEIPLNNVDNTKLLKILFEAKLRSSVEKDLPLQDFSKAIIIAINTAANILIIGTNVYFSKNTIQQLKTFEAKTQLKIKVISGMDINEWLIKNNADKEFSKSLIHLINQTRNSNHISTGIIELHEITKYIEVCMNQTGLIGEQRKLDAKAAMYNLVSKKRSIIIEGDAGIGKTFFIEELCNNISKICIMIHINLSIELTPRTIFMKIMNQVWGLSNDFIEAMDYNEFMDAISRIGEQDINKNVCNGVAEAFQKTDSEYREKSSIFDYLLIQYLQKIFEILQHRASYIIRIINCNSACPESLDFILQIVGSLYQNVRFIIELRTSYYVDMKMDSSNWDDYINKFEHLGTYVQTFYISNWKKEDSKTFLTSIYNGELSDNAKDFILEQTDNIPLLIDTYANYLNATGYLDNISTYLQVEKLKELYIDESEQIIKHLIISICKSSCEIADYLGVLSFFEGQISIKQMTSLLINFTRNKMNILEKTRIVVISENTICIRHLLYLKYIKCHRMDYISKSRLDEIATVIIKKLLQDQTKSEEWYQTIINVSEFLGINSYVEEYAIEYAIILYRKGQYHLCRETLNKVSHILDLSSNNFYSLHCLEVLELSLQIGFYLKDVSDFENESRMKKLNMIISMEKDIISDTQNGCHLICFGYLILARYNHSRGTFATEFSLMKQASSFIETHKQLCTLDDISDTCVEYAIAIKEKEGLLGYIGVLTDMSKKYPQAVGIKYLLNSALYQRDSIFNPIKAEEYLLENKKHENEMTLPDIYHNRVHFANNLLHQKKYDLAQLYAMELMDDAEKIGLKNEVGRIANIIGCTFIKSENRDLDNARSFFEYGISIYKESEYMSYLWPIMVNYIVLSDLQKNYRNVFETVRSITNIFKNYKELVNNIDLQEEVFPKIYVAYLIIIKILKKYQKMNVTKELASQLLVEFLDGIKNSFILKYANGKTYFPQKKLEKTKYSHGKIYLITY